MRGKTIPIIVGVIIVLLVGGVVAFAIVRSGDDDDDKSKTRATNTSTTEKESEAAVAGCELGESKHTQVTDPNGPYYHSVWVGTLGAGKVSDAKQIADRASVPDGVALQDDGIAIYYVSGEDGAMHRGTYLNGEFNDEGFVSIDGIEGPLGAVDPDISRDEKGNYRLVYFAGFGTPNSDKPRAMCLATSTDGVNFTTERKLVEGQNFTDPSLVIREGIWYLSVSEGQNTKVFSSPDGQTFTELATVDGGVGELALDNDGLLALHTCTSNGITAYISQDGTNWQTASESVVSSQAGELVCDPSVVAGTNLYLYKVAPAPTG